MSNDLTLRLILIFIGILGVAGSCKLFLRLLRRTYWEIGDTDYDTTKKTQKRYIYIAGYAVAISIFSSLSNIARIFGIL